jgi:hypothetical protein
MTEMHLRAKQVLLIHMVVQFEVYLRKSSLLRFVTLKLLGVAHLSHMVH